MTPRLRSLPAAAAVALTALALAGCISVFPKAAPAQLYRFGAAEPAAAPPAAAARERIGLVFPPVSFPRASAGDQILAVTGPETAYVAAVRWLAPAAVLMAESTERAFDARSTRVRSLGRGELASAQGFLRLEVTDFEARYSAPGAAPAVHVTLVATLAHRSGAYAADRTFRADVPAAENGARAIVDAYNKAVETVTGELIAWTDANAGLAAEDVPAVNPAGAARAAARQATRTTTSTREETRRDPR